MTLKNLLNNSRCRHWDNGHYLFIQSLSPWQHFQRIVISLLKFIEKHPFRYLCLSDNLTFNVWQSSAELSWSLDWSHFDEWMQITLLRRLHSTYLKIRQKLSGLNGIVHNLQITVMIRINWQFSFIFLILSRCNIIIHAPFIQVQMSYYLTTYRVPFRVSPLIVI